jgi:predicted MFS family arabinose efflux permease
MTLERASSLLQVVDRSARLFGAPLAGLLIATIGPQNVLWLNTLSFAISALLTAAAVPRLAPARAGAPAAQPYLAQLAEGLRFIWRDKLTRTLVLIVLITNFLDAANASVILPVLAQQRYGSALALGLLFGLSGGGAVLGALLYGAVGHRFSRRWVFICAFTAVSLPMLTLALLPPLPVALATQALAGLAAGPINPILSTIQYERVPAAMRGRVFGATTAGAFAAMPLGVLLAGYLLEWAGLQAALLLTGTCYLLTTGSMLFNGSLREMDQPRAGAPAHARAAPAP